MQTQEAPSVPAVVAGCLGLVAAGAWVMHTLPSEVSLALTAWIITSLPIGVLIGHCALNEE